MNKSSSPWTTNFDEMAKKTVLKKVLKYAPLKSDFVRAAAADGTIKEEIAPDMSEVEAIEVEYESVEPEAQDAAEPGDEHFGDEIEM